MQEEKQLLKMLILYAKFNQLKLRKQKQIISS